MDLEIFYKCLTFQGGKKHFFFKKCPNNGLVSEIETISKILQQKFKLLKETDDDNQVHSPIKACAASTYIDIYVPNVNVDINDELLMLSLLH